MRYKPHRKCSEKCLVGPLSPKKRRNKAFRIRNQAAKYYKQRPLLPHPCNRDEKRYPNKIASYSKALPHNKLGEVKLKAYKKYIEALKSGNPEKFENIPLGGSRKLVNPQSGYAFELAGPDSHQLEVPPAPSFNSQEAADEMVELYWQALTRDIPFNVYDTHHLTQTAAEELSQLSDFRGPKMNEKVTIQTLFRINLPGALIGPFVSQFLLKDIPYVATTIEQRYRTTVKNDDHLTGYEDWLAVQNGFPPPTSNVIEPVRRYIHDARGLTEYVHNDFSMEDGLTPCLILLNLGDAALDPNNPYLNSNTQVGFGTFGPVHALDFVSRAARSAIDAVWFQKWLVHRRLRPEEFGGRIHNNFSGFTNYPINPEVINSKAVKLTFEKYGSYLLPQAYAEGCPAHPSYPQGHGSFIGAMVTMLKAFFNEDFIIPDPVVASNDGLCLEPYDGPSLTVGGELNKLASNIAMARDAAGVHYRSDAVEALKVGEAVAIGILRDYRKTYNENFKGFTLTTFDGKKITI